MYVEKIFRKATNTFEEHTSKRLKHSGKCAIENAMIDTYGTK